MSPLGPSGAHRTGFKLWGAGSPPPPDLMVLLFGRYAPQAQKTGEMLLEIELHRVFSSPSKHSLFTATTLARMQELVGRKQPMVHALPELVNRDMTALEGQPQSVLDVSAAAPPLLLMGSWGAAR